MIYYTTIFIPIVMTTIHLIHRRRFRRNQSPSHEDQQKFSQQDINSVNGTVWQFIRVFIKLHQQ